MKKDYNKIEKERNKKLSERLLLLFFVLLVVVVLLLTTTSCCCCCNNLLLLLLFVQKGKIRKRDLSKMEQERNKKLSEMTADIGQQ